MVRTHARVTGHAIFDFISRAELPRRTRVVKILETVVIRLCRDTHMLQSFKHHIIYFIFPLGISFTIYKKALHLTSQTDDQIHKAYNFYLYVKAMGYFLLFNSLSYQLTDIHYWDYRPSFYRHFVRFIVYKLFI